MTLGPVEVEGMAALRRALAELDGDVQARLEQVIDEAAELVADKARPLIPRRSGAARASLSARGGRLTGGGTRVPYYAWLEYGGRAGPVQRRVVPEGRYVMPSYLREQDEIEALMGEELVDLLRDAGWSNVTRS